MKLFNLNESTVENIFNDEFNEFLSDYSDIYDKSLFVLFSDQAQLTFQVSKGFPDIPHGMVTFPLNFVVNNPAHFSEFSKSKYLYVISVSGNVLSMANIRYKHVDQLAQIMNVTREDLENFMDSYEETFRLDSSLLYPYLFNTLIWKRTNKGKIEESKVSPEEVTYRLQKLNVDVYYNNASTASKAIISESYPAIAIFLERGTYKEEARYDLRTKTNSGDEATHDVRSGEELQYYRDKEHIRELAEIIAHNIKTRLNSDPAYVAFLDFYFWTTEGIEIKITVAFSSDDNPNNDGIYYIVEGKTPFGLLIHSSSSSDTFEEIGADVGEIYNRMTTISPDWMPKNRDIFLNRQRQQQRIVSDQAEDIQDIVDRYYPRMREYARVKRIYLPVLRYFSDYEKLFINDLMETFIHRKEPSKYDMIEKLEEDDFNFDNFLFKPLPNRITVNFIKKFAMVYDIAKQKFPSRKGWHIFRDF